MAEKYRNTPIQDQTISSFSEDTNTPGFPSNSALELSEQKDQFVFPEVKIEDFERAVKYFLQVELPAKINDNGQIIDVPVVYASAERWASVQERGYLRDHKGKLQTPVIAFKLNNFEARQDIPKADVLKGNGSFGFSFKTGYSKKNRYDDFSVVTNAKPVEDYYVVGVPEYIEAFFDIYIWCDSRPHLNQLFEKLKFYSGRAIGDTFKFPIMFDGFNIDLVNVTGEDRLVRGLVNCRLKSFILLKDTENKQIGFKGETRSRVVVITEII